MGRSRIAFVCDESNFHLGECVRGYPVLTYRDIGLSPGTADRSVVRHAREHGAIIISRNRGHFREEMLKAAQASGAYHCHEGCGLLLVADEINDFHFERITKQLVIIDPRTTRRIPISWEHVFDLNLEVHICADHSVVVRLLPRCARCIGEHADCQECNAAGINEFYASAETGAA